ncbi:MAG: hypothetical protein ACFCBW_00370 [Candidatus Competibacterales bacterium]
MIILQSKGYLVLLVGAVVLLGGVPQGWGSPVAMWDEVVDDLETVLTLEERHDQLPPQALWGANRASNRRAIHELLDQIVDRLKVSALDDLRHRRRQLEAAIASHQRRIADLRRERVSAPDRAWWRDTKADIDRALEEARATLRDEQRALANLKGDFKTALRAEGLPLDDAQVEFLLATVVGDEVIDLALVAERARELVALLERLVADSDEDIAMAQRYYGLYGVMLKAMERQHQQLIDAIDHRYLVALDTLMAKTIGLQAETERLLDAPPPMADESRSRILLANREAQTLTLRTAELYKRFLKSQVWEVEAARERLLDDIAVAENTYQTAALSGELVALLDVSQRRLERLLTLDVPPLRPFRNIAVKREFERLTQTLKAEGL